MKALVKQSSGSWFRSSVFPYLSHQRPHEIPIVCGYNGRDKLGVFLSLNERGHQIKIRLKYNKANPIGATLISNPYLALIPNSIGHLF